MLVVYNPTWHWDPRLMYRSVLQHLLDECMTTHMYDAHVQKNQLLDKGQGDGVYWVHMQGVHAHTHVVKAREEAGIAKVVSAVEA